MVKIIVKFINNIRVVRIFLTTFLSGGTNLC
jgi:hypothetical protein